MKTFLRIFLATFSVGIFYHIFFRYFFYQLRSNRGAESGVLKLLKMCVFDFKMTFLAKKTKKHKNKKYKINMLVCRARYESFSDVGESRVWFARFGV